MDTVGRVTSFGGRRWWAPRDSGWWVAFPFTIGSILFMAGAVMPAMQVIPDAVATVTFFVGSSLYLIGASAQVLDEVITSRRARSAPNVSARSLARWSLVGGVVQAVGAVLFQTNLTAAFARDLSIAQQERLLWVPDLLGSVLFLVASAIFFRLHRPIQGRKEDGDQRHLALLNIIGSAFFIVSAVGAYVSPLTGEEIYPMIANLGTLIGALFFLISSLPGLPRRSVGAATR